MWDVVNLQWQHFGLTPFSGYDKLDPRLVTGNAGKTTMEMILLFLFWFCPFLILKKNRWVQHDY